MDYFWVFSFFVRSLNETETAKINHVFMHTRTQLHSDKRRIAQQKW